MLRVIRPQHCQYKAVGCRGRPWCHSQHFTSVVPHRSPLAPRDMQQGLELFGVFATEGRGLLLGSSTQGPGLLLCTPQFTGQPCTTERYPIQNVNRKQVRPCRPCQPGHHSPGYDRAASTGSNFLVVKSLNIRRDNALGLRQVTSRAVPAPTGQSWPLIHIQGQLLQGTCYAH